jgi:allantoate deiminase
LGEAIAAFGGNPELLSSAARDPQDLLAYVEVHIEQGPVLEARGLPVGVVSAIAGQSRLSVTFTGQAGHAGTVPMALRHDALTAAAEFALAVEAQAQTEEGLVATVGQFEVEPGASNVVPGRVQLSLDVRHADDDVRARTCTLLRERAERIASVRKMGIDWHLVASNSAVRCDTALSQHLGEAIAADGVPMARLVSGAGHDAVSLAQIVPVAMLFVRCEGGISHNPREAVAPGDIAVAIEVMDRFLERLSAETMPQRS